MLDFLLSADEKLFLFLNGLYSPFFDVFMEAISGKYIWIPLYLFLVFWMIRRRKASGLWILLFAVLLFALTDLTAVHFFKNVFERLRPCRDPDIMDKVHLVNGHCGGKFGFISSHAANTFGLTFFMVFIFRERWLSISLVTWAVVVSYSRIYLGVHYPGDVIAGALWAILLAYVVYWLYKAFTTRLTKNIL